MTLETKLITLQIDYKIDGDKLNTNINYPANFLMLPEVDQVQIISALVDTLNNMEVPEITDREFVSIDKTHREMIDECSEIFPFRSFISLDLTNKEKSIPIEFTHDETIGSLHPNHLLVIMDSIVKVMKATAIMIVKKANKATEK